MGPYKIPLPITARAEATAPAGTERKEIIYDGYHYDVTDFIQRHPGGVELLEYYTQQGEDATIAISQFHNRSKGQVETMMKSMKRRPVVIPREFTAEEKERSVRNKAMTDDFMEMFRELEEAGYFKPDYLHVTWRFVEIVLIFILGYHTLINYKNFVAQIIATVLIGFGHGRIGFLTHELGHVASTGKKSIDSFIGTVLIGVGWGMSFTWWSLYHSPHHAMPQRLHRDRAVEPFEFMISNVKSVEDDPKPTRRFIMKNQVYHLFLDTFAGLFVMQGQSWSVIWETKHLFEAALVGVHFYLASYLGLWSFLASRLLWSAYSYGQVALSHAHLPVAEGPTHWAEYALVYTVNMTPSSLVTFWTGYLNFQIEHHLFPTMPDHQLPKVSGRVKQFAAKHSLPYQVLSYPEAVTRTIENFWEVSIELNKTL